MVRKNRRVLQRFQQITLILKLMMLVTLTDTTKAGATKALPTKKGVGVTKALSTKKWGVDAKIAMENETLHWHEVTSKQKEHVLDTIPQEMAQETTACVYERSSKKPRVDKRPDQRRVSM